MDGWPTLDRNQTESSAIRKWIHPISVASAKSYLKIANHRDFTADQLYVFNVFISPHYFSFIATIE